MVFIELGYYLNFVFQKNIDNQQLFENLTYARLMHHVFAVQRKDLVKYQIDLECMEMVTSFELPDIYDCFQRKAIFEQALTQYWQNLLDNIERHMVKRLLKYFQWYT